MDTVEYTNIIHHKANIRQRIDDGYLSATDMCKVNNKLYEDWSRLGITKSYLSTLSNDIEIPIPQLVQVKKDGNINQQGTWVHPQVAVNLAQWISPKLEVFVNKLMIRYIGYTALMDEIEKNKSLQQQIAALQIEIKEKNILSEKKRTAIYQRCAELEEKKLF